jgi:hypothetical protein
LGVGTVQPYLSKQDGKRAGWRAMWRDHDGKQRSKSFDRKSDAQKHLSTIEADLLRGTYVDPRAGQVTLAEFAEDWMTKQEWRPATRTLADSHMRNHIGPGLGTRPLLSITRTDVQGFVTDMSRGENPLSPTTIDGVYRRLVSILEAAVHDRKIPRRQDQTAQGQQDRRRQCRRPRSRRRASHRRSRSAVDDSFRVDDRHRRTAAG